MSAAIKRWGLQTLNKLIARNPSRSLQTLAYEEIKSNSSSDKPYTATAFVLHGLLGSSRNWRSFSKNLLSSLSNSSSPLDWRMVLVDLRNHGRSADIKDGIFPPHDLVNSAKDLADLVEAKGWEWPDVVMGHSLGGKVALQFVESCARGDYGNSAVLPKQECNKHLGLRGYIRFLPGNPTVVVQLWRGFGGRSKLVAVGSRM